MTSSPIVDVDAVDSECPLTVARQRHMQTPFNQQTFLILNCDARITTRAMTFQMSHPYYNQTLPTFWLYQNLSINPNAEFCSKEEWYWINSNCVQISADDPFNRKLLQTSFIRIPTDDISSAPNIIPTLINYTTKLRTCVCFLEYIYAHVSGCGQACIFVRMSAVSIIY